MRTVVDTSVLIAYLQGDDDARDALSVASQIGQVLITCVNYLELWKATNQRKVDIQRQEAKIRNLANALGFRYIYIGPGSQKMALQLLKHCYGQLSSREAIPDSLLIGVALTRRAHLLTCERPHKWQTMLLALRRQRAVTRTPQVYTPATFIQLYS